jgi:lysophospholipid acyltransferase (LPLAT)-like uncharacterized protein
MLKHQWKKIKRGLLSYSYAYVGKYLLRVLFWTCRTKIEGIERFVKHASEEKCILMLWHNRLSMVAEILNKHAPQFIYTAFISKSRDGEPLAILASSYKSGKTIRVPHNARHRALKQVIVSLKTHQEVIVITPDGPRGPRYQVKPGIALAAKETQATIVPFSWKADRYWELKTWDGLRFPKPFANIQVVLGEPIKANGEASFDLEALQSKLQSSLEILD